MRKSNSAQFIFCILFSLFHFAAGAQLVFGMYEKAGTIGRGGVELSAQYSHYFAAVYGASGSLSNNLGVRAGIGLSKKFDLKLRYERLLPTGVDRGSSGSYNYISLVPKVAFVPEKLSLFVPISLYSFKSSNPYYGTATSRSYSFAPHLIYTHTAASNKFDFSTMADVDVMFNSDDGNYGPSAWGGIKFGAGFSNNLRQWAVRPEAGLLFKPSVTGIFWQVGVSFQMLLHQ